MVCDAESSINIITDGNIPEISDRNFHKELKYLKEDSIMKKVLSAVLLLSGLLLYGCGMGGGTSATSDGGNTVSTPGGGSQPQVGAPQVFTLNLVDADAARVVSRHTTTAPLPDPTDVRVVMRLFDSVTTTTHICPEDVPCYDVTNTRYTEVYKDVQEMTYTGTGAVKVSLPPATGYTIDVITSRQTVTTEPHKILKYGQVKDVIVSAGTTSASVTVKDVGSILNMQVKDNILSSTPTNTVSFDVAVNNALPFSPIYSLSMILSGSTYTFPSSANKCTINAPINNTGTTQSVTVTGTFTLNNDLLKLGESNAAWSRIFPDPEITGESVYYNLSQLVSVTVL
jgi:hypothetical protein